MKTDNKISAIIPVYHGEKTIGETLESIKGVVDEIIVVHDGPCEDNTLKIAKKFTKKIYTPAHKGRSAFPFALGLKKAKYNWILKLDDDESLSNELRKNIRKLIQEKDIDAFSFIHPLWNGKEPITKTWPRKTILVRKSTISYLGFPGFDMNINTTGKVRKTNYILWHKPVKNQDVGWEGYREKVLGRYAPSQAKNVLKDPKEFPTFQYKEKGLPLRIRMRKVFPLLTNTLFAFLAPFKQLFLEGGIREGRLGLNVAMKTFFYNIYLGRLIQKEKSSKKNAQE